MGEHANAQGELAIKSRETDAKIALIAAQIEKIHAEIGQAQAELQIKAQQTEIAGRKTEADIEQGGAQVEIARQTANDGSKKTDAEIAHRGAEIELGAHKQQTEASLKGRELDHKGREIDNAEKELPAKVELTKAQAKAATMPKGKEAKADEPKRKKTTTKVTKHDDKGRILEFVQESD
jgi:hypothetical protein